MDFKKLMAYQKTFDLAMEIFEISKSFPKEKMYSLTDQIRRSSRAVNDNRAEAYRKRRYPKHFISKLTNSDGKNSETSTWLDYAFSSNYIAEPQHLNLISQNIEVGKLINYMINHPSKFGAKEDNQ